MRLRASLFLLPLIVNKVKTDSSGCVVTYVGLICEYSRGKPVVSVEYEDAPGTARSRLQEIAGEVKQKLPTQKKETYQDGSTWVEGE